MRQETKSEKPRDISVAFNTVQNSSFFLKVSLGIGIVRIHSVLDFSKTTRVLHIR